MRQAARLLSVIAVLVLASQALAKAQELTSTCWISCINSEDNFVEYTEPGTTQRACCGGSALSCPPGYSIVYLAWGEPAELCEDF